VDIDDKKLDLCKQWGVIPFNAKNGEVVRFVENSTSGIGADGVIITASEKKDEIISQAARMSRKRGRIILVGVIGLNIRRADFYEKELTFQVSCSYGPGRYDEDYEIHGHDYPLGYVRWTEKRNFEAVLQSLASGTLHVKDLITEIEPISNFHSIYSNLGSGKSIASILKYDTTEKEQPAHTIQLKNASYNGSKGVVGVIGAGNFTKMTMLPALKGNDANYKYIASASGLSSSVLAKKYGFSHSTTDYRVILDDKDVDLVLITTRHDKHAAMASEALSAGKHVFVEKPLALNEEQLDEVFRAYNRISKSLTVGFNRRFSPHSLKVKSLVGEAPMNVITTVNAGYIANSVWVHDLEVGGGRIIGEACHFIDLITFLTGSRIKEICMNAMGINPGNDTDNASILLKYENGSTGVVNYFSNGSKLYAKERIEVYSLGRTVVIDNFRITSGYGFKGFSKFKTQLDKGHKNQFRQLIHRVKTGGEPLVPFDEIVNTTRASFAALESLKTNSWIPIL
jgi:predicted dehydrogenase